MLDKVVKNVKESDLSDIVSLTQELVKIKSLSGEEKAVADFLINYTKEKGFDEYKTDGMGNFIGKVVMGNGNGPKIMFTGHMDTVNVNPDDWSEDTKPFDANIKDGKVFGRGTADMKGADAAMITAMTFMKNFKDDFNGELYFVGTTVEELFEGVSIMEPLSEIQPDYLIIGEASECNLNFGQRGRAEITLTLFGKNQHAASGRTVVNVIEQLAPVIEQFDVHYRSEVDDILGKRNIVPTDVKIPIGGGGGVDGRGGNSTVPNRIELTYDIRTLVGDTEDSIKELVRENLKPVMEKIRKRYPDFKDIAINCADDKHVTYTGVSICRSKFAPAWKTEKDSDMGRSAIAAFEELNSALGGKFEYSLTPKAYSFCTDGSAVVDYRKNFPNKKIELVGLGPGPESSAHIVNEFVEISELYKVFYGYLGLISKLLEKK
jgi:acetylornithine deacetylase/succinyl-diaminopimelate desuccinylase-like protein